MTRPPAPVPENMTPEASPRRYRHHSNLSGQTAVNDIKLTYTKSQGSIALLHALA